MLPLPFVLIADDYGIAPGVNRAILELLALRRLSGTSVMANMPDFTPYAEALRLYSGQVDLGLHLNLTLGAPLGPMPGFAPSGTFPTHREIMRRAFSGGLRQAEITAEILRQIRHFEAKMGRLPNYIDGHQHVHVLPVIRAALFEAIAGVGPEYRPWLRNPSDRFGAIVARGVAVKKSLFIAGLSRGFKAAAKRQGLAVNDSFSGASDFNSEQDYAPAFPRYLMAAGPRHVVMCHPGYVDATLESLDPVTATRPMELEYFKGSAFTDTLEAMNMRVERFG